MPTCRYCKRENAETKCIYCDGKLSARDIRRRLLIEQTSKRYNYKNNVFNEENVKRELIKRDILGLEGLNKDDRAIFFSAFNAEWTKLKSQEFLGH